MRQLQHAWSTCVVNMGGQACMHPCVSNELVMSGTMNTHKNSPSRHQLKRTSGSLFATRITVSAPRSSAMCSCQLCLSTWCTAWAGSASAALAQGGRALCWRTSRALQSWALRSRAWALQAWALRSRARALQAWALQPRGRALQALRAVGALWAPQACQACAALRWVEAMARCTSTAPSEGL